MTGIIADIIPVNKNYLVIFYFFLLYLFCVESARTKYRLNVFHVAEGAFRHDRHEGKAGYDEQVRGHPAGVREVFFAHRAEGDHSPHYGKFRLWLSDESNRDRTWGTDSIYEIEREEEEMKKLINCPACTREVSPNAKRCPQCGERIKKMRPETIAYTVVILIVAFFAWAMMSASNDARKMREEQAQFEQERQRAHRETMMQAASMGIDTTALEKKIQEEQAKTAGGH
jgi:hypothetical protein